MSFPKISEYINNRQPNLALNALLETWASFNNLLAAGEFSFADFQIRMGPSLAEAFLPQYASDHHRCLILESYRSDRQSTLAKFQELRECIDNSRRRFGQEVKPPIFQTLENQMKLCEAVAELDTDAGEAAFDELLQNAYQQFSLGVWNEAAFDEKGTRSAAFHRLQANNPGNDIAQKIDEWVQHRGLSWRHPRVAYVVDALQSLIDAKGCSGSGIPKSPDEWHPGQTWLLLALDESTRSTSCVDGLLLALQIEVLAKGCGAFYPCPSFAGHLVLDASFQQAFYDAWRLECEFSLGHHQNAFDYRWSLVVMDDSQTVKKLDDQTIEKFVRSRTPIRHRLRSHLLLTPLQGPSASLGIAAGLRSAIRQTALDRFRASSAAFNPLQSPANRKANSLTRGSSASPLNPLLETVGSLGAKQHALIDPDRQQKLNAIRQIVTANGQSSHSSSLNIEPVPCLDFETGYRELSLGGQFEDHLRQVMLEKGIKHFEDRCFMPPGSLAEVAEIPLQLTDDRLGSYQLNRLSRVKPNRHKRFSLDNQKNPIDHNQDRTCKLNKRGQERILTGNLYRASQKGMGWRQVRLIAESGLGKTTLLHRIVLQMASRKSECIPILLEGLSSFLENGNHRKFLDRVFDEFWPELRNISESNHENVENECRKHFKALVKSGRVCFLCDALDQTDQSGRLLGGIIDKLKQARFILTMRREALSKLNKSKCEWDTILVRPFSRKTAEEYLGEHASLFIDAVGSDSEHSKVLSIPLILYLLKEFAKEGRLPRRKEDLPKGSDFSNRYGIFRQFILGEGGLIDRGLKSLEQEDERYASFLVSKPSAIRLLAKMSFWQIQKHYFDVFLRGDALSEWFEACREKLHSTATEKDVLYVVVKGLNLLTSRSMLEEQGASAIAWRHRSFPEFLAGLHLATLAMSDKEEERNEALATICDLSDSLKLDANGKPRGNLRADWYWTLRIALNHEYVSRGRRGEVSRLAEWLISYGNPFVVHDAIVEDGVKVHRDLEDVVRWLVHWTYYTKNYSYAYTEKTKGGEHEVPPELNEHLAEILVPMFERCYRNGPVLPAAWVLLEQNARVHPTSYERAKALFFCDLTEIQCLRDSVNAWLGTGYVDIPLKGISDFYLWQLGLTGFQMKQRVNALSMSRYTLSNTEYEWMDPAHRFNRSSYSEDPDQPAVNVSWYMARLYGVWLTGNLRMHDPNSAREYRLPNEVEIEFAIRGGSVGAFPTNHVGKPDENWKRFNSAGHGVGKPMGRLFKLKSEDAKAEDYMNGFGVVHPVGDVCIWAENRYDDLGPMGNVKNPVNPLLVGSRSIRGGSYYDDESVFRVSYRYYDRPYFLFNYIGFRLICILR